MCGILCVFEKKGEQINDREITAMRDEMAHRGPDDAGLTLAFDRRLALAHRRLSILDLSMAGHQPMKSRQGNYIIFNGEIYNYIELKEKYLKETLLRSSSDTEVLMQMIDRYNTESFNYLNGMWAFVYYNEERKELLISRDRYGVKPMYYYENEDVFIVSSEIKPILKSSHYRKRVNQDIIQLYLDGLEETIEETCFEGIRRFPKASYMVYSLDSNCKKVSQYYSISDSLCEISPFPEDNIRRFKELFFDSVKIRMRSDVPVGVCLSGGLDSSSIYSVASEISSNRLHSFSSKFTEKEYDESYFYGMVTNKYPGYLHEVTPQYTLAEEKLRKIIYYLEEPSKAMGVFPQWHVMELASPHVKVLLDGQGGDELLGGYDPYLFYYFADIKDKDPDILEQSLAEVADIKGTEFLEPIPRVVEIIQKTKEKLNDSFLNAKLLQEFGQTMLPALLKYEDKMGMAFSIEARLPFLDYRLVDFAFSLNETYKIKNGWSKYILRESMKEILPEDIRMRKDKKGFPTPLNQILNHNKNLYRYIPEGITDEWIKWRYLSVGIWKEIFEL